MEIKTNEPLCILSYVSDQPEYAISDIDMVGIITQLKEGEELWYRDYDGNQQDCISLYKSVVKTKLLGEEVYIFSYQTDPDCIHTSEACIVNANIREQKSEDDPSLTTECLEYSLIEALQQMHEWTDYHGMMLIEEETYNKYFGNK